MAYSASVLLVFLIAGVLPALFVLFATIVLWLSAADLRRYGSFPTGTGSFV